MMLRRFAACLILLMAGCGAPEPLRIGFIGGLSGRFSDLGEAGRNGAQLAVEECNQKGGIGGRSVEFLIRDDAQDAARAAAVTRELIAAKVEAIVGPMTSSMAEIVVPIINAAGIATVSPTVTARRFFGQDDHFFLVMPSTRGQATVSAQHQFFRAGVRRVVAIHDLRNQAYTGNWLDDFTAAFSELGGEVEAIPFDSATFTAYDELATRALAAHPQAILLLSSAVDTARLAQKLRQQKPQIRLFASMWATTERLIELGGHAVEGLVSSMDFDRDSNQPRYLAFRQSFITRFKQEPGFAGVAGYDAMRAVLAALAKREQGQTMKAALLRFSPYDGAQQSFAFDGNGDSQRQQHIAVIRDGRFVVLE